MAQTTDIRHISQEDLALLGAPKVVYIRPVVLVQDDDNAHQEIPGFALFAANGQRLAITQSFDEAVGVALDNDMAPVTVH